MAMTTITFQMQLLAGNRRWSSPKSQIPQITNTNPSRKHHGTPMASSPSAFACDRYLWHLCDKNFPSPKPKGSNRSTTSRIKRASLNNSTETSFDVLDAYDDDYGGVVIDAEGLPSSIYVFAAMLRSSLSYWQIKGKRGIWLKILATRADLVPIAVKEGFEYHHAETSYVMLVHWLPNGPCLLPATGSHQVGIGGFVVNNNREVLVVKEKTCPLRCSGLWKLPTGFIDKSEEIYLGAIREIKEETGIDTEFLEVVAFRHAHHVAFEKSDLFFICMLKPLTFEIQIEESEIQDAKWMPLQEFVAQPFYKEDIMSRKAIEICMTTYDGRYKGFSAHQVISKFDDRLSYLYYKD